MVKPRHLMADQRTMFRTHILPAIVAVWGAAIVIHTLIAGTDGSGAYATGQLVGGGIGLVMLVLGGRALLQTRAS
jgi:hypothetical protein